MAHNFSAPVMLSEVRNCSRCLIDFRNYGGARRRICPACHKPASARPAATVGGPLSGRQKQIVDCIIDGKPNKVIAFELHLTEWTIKAYISAIFDKTGTDNRTGLAVWGMNLRAA